MRNVLNTLRVLEEVAARQPIGVGELARVLDLPKSTVQRALVTLDTAGWIRPAAGEVTRWVITTKALAVGGSAGGDLGLRGTALPVLEDLRRSTGETIHLTIPENGKMVLIERLETGKPVRTSMALGHALPMHASANGKAVLAFTPPDDLRSLLRDDLPRYTDTTITDPESLRAELNHIRAQGFAVNHGEWRSDVGAVAAAVLSPDGHPLGSLSINLPIGRLTPDSEPTFGAAVYASAATLSARLV
ncbi:IclR family transcriptional regulator [Nocardia seriolae]|uniref:IclR family transcriptional regulator n=1 Tax=Nocardia seriolae TaxID=37332 RepID=UPI0003F418F1|nr:IclR family transcriptional regulator [Nocardia seriolae]MTJ63744.1 helix-turn-helix domain-containing protein [Nocardia seriolae]MTJ74029.1 helix-turn-helix domain-containing protein [Nocardia seriolae]MTJ88308.1 helix-turn-helix domain-containing protein [Nocardia seriolae]MTK32294.1 helix-turn-helix domain-containing protein [Nocardia seriolae]MTK41631.1 helix-turn-helix domain-containing protein [Nocardia seriolae]